MMLMGPGLGPTAWAKEKEAAGRGAGKGSGRGAGIPRELWHSSTTPAKKQCAFENMILKHTMDYSTKWRTYCRLTSSCMTASYVYS